MSRSNFIVRGGGDFSKLYQELNTAQKRMNGFKKGISNTMKGITALFGGLAIGKLVKDFSQTAMRTETLEVAMNSVARSSGYATDELEKHRQAVRDMGIASQESMTILTRFMQAQLDTADASKLARVAQDAAVIANVNSSEAAEQMTEAIAKQRPQLLSAFGMTRNLNEIYKDYATTIGVTAKELTEAEKKQAMLNYILSEGEKIAGTYEASMGAVGKQIGSLPRHWQDFQNAIATPLALPGISVAVQAITNALKGAVVWAEANRESLAHYGRMVAGVVEGAVNGFRWIGQTLADNWGMIKNVTTALLAYATATKAVTWAMTAWATVGTALNGTLLSKIPILSTLSTAVGIYRVQLHLASASAVATSGAMFKLRTALYAVYTAIGPVGWAILGVSALIIGAMGLWSKYSNSVRNTNQSIQQSTALTEEQKANLQKSNDALKSMNENAKLAGQGQNKLADGIKKAEKAAKGSLAGFDEINTLQSNMGASQGVGVPEINIPDIDIPDFDGIEFDLGLDGLLDDIEMIKPTLSGFWDWIKEEYSNLFKLDEDSIKSDHFEKIVEWGDTLDWLSERWQDVKKDWNKIGGWFGSFFSRIGEDLKTDWGKITTWFGERAEDVREDWEKITGWISSFFVGAWEDVKTDWNKFVTWVGDWKIWGWLGDRIDDVKRDAKKIWVSVKTAWQDFSNWISTKFNDGLTKTKETFSDIGSWFGDRYQDVKNVFKNVGSWFGARFGEAWTDIRLAFTNPKAFFNGVWRDIQSAFGGVGTWFETTFSGAWDKVRRVFSKGGAIFIGIKDGISSTFKTIVNGLITGINRLISKPFNAINSMLNTIRNASFLGISPFKNLWSENPLSVPQIPKLAQGGYIGANKPLLAMIGDNRHEGEIVAPESKLYEQTFKAITDALGNSSGGNQEIVVKLGKTEIFREIINGINSTQKQAGRTLLDV